MLSKQILYKVRPVATDKIKIPEANGNWTLPEGSKYYDKNRRVLLVRHLFVKRPDASGNDRDPTPQNSTKDYFYIDVPKHFFGAADEDGGELGDFIANPAYKESDILVVQWTGYGKYSGWIDTTVQMRGAGIGSVIEQGGVACAKWS